MNVTDIAVGPDGCLYFCLGGRNTQGGVYRIVHAPTKTRTHAEDRPTSRCPPGDGE